MLHQNDFTISKLAAYHQAGLHATARTAAVRKAAKSAGKPLQERVLLSIAAVLILSGKKLQTRYEPRFLPGKSHG